jgi:hypothetical protein
VECAIRHAARGGGLVIATGNVLQPGTALETYLAARQATREFGTYASGKAVARTGLRMMPTFPLPPLKFRTAGFPQYGFKVSRSVRACPNDARVKRAPRIPRPPRGLRPPSRTLRRRDPRYSDW